MAKEQSEEGFTVGRYRPIRVETDASTQLVCEVRETVDESVYVLVVLLRFLRAEATLEKASLVCTGGGLGQSFEGGWQKRGGGEEKEDARRYELEDPNFRDPASLREIREFKERSMRCNA